MIFLLCVVQFFVSNSEGDEITIISDIDLAEAIKETLEKKKEERLLHVTVKVTIL